jgi:dTDP-4-amino-4,6-dideoxygalactose transaminase
MPVATPVFVDCDPYTWEIDYTKIEEKITPKTKAVIGYIYMQPFDIEGVAAICKKHNLKFKKTLHKHRGQDTKANRLVVW